MIFQQIISVRDQLSDLAYKNNVFVANLANNLVDSDGVGSTQVNGISVYQNATGDLSFTYDGITTSLAKSEVVNHLSDIIPNTSYSVSDIFQTISSSGDLYGGLAALTTKFSYSERMQLTDINQALNRVNVNSSPGNYDINVLYDQLVAVSDNEGYVSGRSWLITMENWFKACQEGANNESPELDSTDPGTISGLYNIISTVASTVLSAIFSALSIIFGAVFALIGTALQAITSLISNALDHSVSVNYDAPNTFMRGVASSAQNFVPAASPIWNVCKDDYQINYLTLPSCGMFFWKGDSYLKIKVNSYIAPHISPDKLAQYLLNASANTLSQLGGVLMDYTNNTINNRYFAFTGSTRATYFPDQNTLSLDDDEQARIQSDEAFYCACVVASEFYRWICSCPLYIPTYSGDNWEANKISGYAQQNMPVVPRAIAFGWMIITNRMNGVDYFTNVSQSIVCDVVNNLTSFYFSNRELFLDEQLRMYWDTAYTHCGYCLNPLFTNCTSIVHRPGAVALYYYDNDNHEVRAYSTYFDDAESTYYSSLKANCLPVSFGAKCNAITSESLLQAMVLMAVVATAAAVVNSKLQRAVRKKRIKKDILRSKRISDAKIAWENDPTNTTLLNDYVNEVDRYNRLGKIFGWGSYDASNAWINKPEAGNSIPSVLNPVMSIANKVEDIQDSTTDISTIKAGINRILNILNGSSLE